MKLLWSPETAAEAYLDTVKTCKAFDKSSEPEMLSAMAAGWNAKMIVETWQEGGAMATSIGLAIASHHSGGRHVCIVADEASRLKYTEEMEKVEKSAELIVGEPEEAVQGLEGIDFMVVDCRRNGFARIFKETKLGEKGSVLICKNALSVKPDFCWRSVLDTKSRIVRTTLLPVGKGLDIAYIGASSGEKRVVTSRWIKDIDPETGEEIAIRQLFVNGVLYR